VGAVDIILGISLDIDLGSYVLSGFFRRLRVLPLSLSLSLGSASPNPPDVSIFDFSNVSLLWTLSSSNLSKSEIFG